MSTVLFVICTIALVVDGRPHDHDLEMKMKLHPHLHQLQGISFGIEPIIFWLLQNVASTANAHGQGQGAKAKATLSGQKVKMKAEVRFLVGTKKTCSKAVSGNMQQRTGCAQKA